MKITKFYGFLAILFIASPLDAMFRAAFRTPVVKIPPKHIVWDHRRAFWDPQKELYRLEQRERRRVTRNASIVYGAWYGFVGAGVIIAASEWSRR